MAEMSPSGADWVCVSEWPEADGRGRFRCMATARADAHQAFRQLRQWTRWPRRSEPRPLRAGVGEVFYDHVRGVLDPAPRPELDVSPPFLLVTHHAYVDWNATDTIAIRRFGRAASLLDHAAELVAEERAAGRDAERLWAVYGARVTRFREL